MLPINPSEASIFRITHIDNVKAILSRGIYCRNSPSVDPNFRNIGNKDLIQKRHTREVPIIPKGVLSDYVPFYFTYRSIMFFNIHTGHGGVEKLQNEDIVIIESSLHRIVECGIPFVFTNKHAYLQTTEYFNNLEDLDRIDWNILQKSDFKTDPEDPGKKERYHAEALIHQHVPIEAIVSIACYSDAIADKLNEERTPQSSSLQIKTCSDWYFS